VKTFKEAMHKRKSAILIFLILCVTVSVFSQSQKQIDQTVLRKLQEIKPKNTRTVQYRIVVPKKIIKLPQDMQLNIVYKLGHYKWELVALRFESKSNSDLVTVSKMLHSSAFPFYREMVPGKDEYKVQTGTLSKKEFNRLVLTAIKFYNSNIIRRPESFIGCSSSGDGLVVFNLFDRTNEPKLFLKSDKGDGSLVGGISERTECGFEEVIDTLFCEVFYDYLKDKQIFVDLEKEQAESLLTARSLEPPITDNYRDYFRQALLFELLGEFGSEKAIPVLEKIVKESKLEDEWKKNLVWDLEDATLKIKARAGKIRSDKIRSETPK
jgi:hypothetical protein